MAKSVFNKATGKHQKRAPQVDRSTTEIIKDALFGATPRPLRERKMDVDKVVDEISKLKRIQDKLAGISRRQA